MRVFLLFVAGGLGVAGVFMGQTEAVASAPVLERLKIVLGWIIALLLAALVFGQIERDRAGGE